MFLPRNLHPHVLRAHRNLRSHVENAGEADARGTETTSGKSKDPTQRCGKTNHREGGEDELLKARTPDTVGSKDLPPKGQLTKKVIDLGPTKKLRSAPRETWRWTEKLKKSPASLRCSGAD